MKNFLATVCVAHPEDQQYRRQESKFSRYDETLSMRQPHDSSLRFTAMKPFLQDVISMGTHLFP